jgi:CRP/FNR family transcriptional regulator, cyclic AMP receptor protein
VIDPIDASEWLPRLLTFQKDLRLLTCASGSTVMTKQSGFQPTSENTVLSLCTEFPQIEVDAGEVLLSEGAQTGILYVLIHGEVEILKGDFLVDTISQPGTVFGEISLLLDIPHTATVRTSESSRVYKIDGAAAFLDAHPELVRELSVLLARRLHRTTSILLDLKHHLRGLPSALIGVTLEDSGII